MPCTSEGYSEKRVMDPGEQWRSLSRHHRAVEIETERWRSWAREVRKIHGQLNAVLGNKLAPLPSSPNETPPWDGKTYRDADGKFPSDVQAHCDWLSEEDFK